MPISHSTKVYAVADCKVYALLTDPAGGAATYGTGVDVPGIKTMEIGGDINSVDLRGDNGPLDQASTLGSVTVKVDHAKVSLDVLAVILGSTSADTGTTPNQVATATIAGGQTLGYFKIEGKTPTGGGDTPLGDVHYTLHKCILTSFPDLGFAEEDYRLVSFTAVAVPTNATGAKILTTTLNETAAAIA